jgi:enoyl-CoA hydratase/carnithine racemase
MGEPTVLVERDEPVAVLRLNRPDKHNALSQQLIGEAVELLEALDADPGIRVVILAGNDRAFSTGADLNDGLKVTNLPDTMRYQRHQRRLTETIEALSMPVIAAIGGYCITGGLEVALACDIRIASDNATFGVTSAKIGSVPGLGGTQRLPRLIGQARAKELLFTADFIDAAEADRIGLVNRVTTQEELMPTAMALARRMAERAPLSQWLIKRAVNVGMGMDLESALYFEGQCTALSFPTEDRNEGWRSFLEKRDPVFRGV